MKSYFAYFESEFKIFEEILHGRLNPSHSTFNDATILPTLIEYANHHEIIIKKNELENIKLSARKHYLRLGYRNQEDIIIQVSGVDESDYVKINILPGQYYLKGDLFSINISNPSNYKSLCFLKLIIDEYERIKIRSCALLSDDIENLQHLALKNLRIIEHLLRETSAIINITSATEPDNITELYILDCLKKFIIKSIQFYHTIFDPYLNSYKDSSADLIKSCDQLRSPEFINYLVKQDLEDSSKYRLEEPIPKYHTSKPSLIWTSKINKLTTIFYNLVEEGIIQFVPNNKKISKKNVTNMVLVEFICKNFLDINGENLSKDTIRTYLNPHRPDKRSKRTQ